MHFTGDIARPTSIEFPSADLQKELAAASATPGPSTTTPVPLPPAKETTTTAPAPTTTAPAPTTTESTDEVKTEKKFKLPPGAVPMGGFPMGQPLPMKMVVPSDAPEATPVTKIARYLPQLVCYAYVT